MFPVLFPSKFLFCLTRRLAVFPVLFYLQDHWGGSRYNFYYQPYIIVNEENYLYDLLKVAAEFGGYVGVLLGVSLLQGAKNMGKLWRERYVALE